MNQQQYDLVIIGAGSGGLVAARFAAQLGAKVALVEKNRIGGDCTWTGCVPSKALVKAAKVAHQVRTAARYGVEAAPPVVDMAAVHDFVHRAIATVYQFETPEELAKQGVDVVLGTARFQDPYTIEANGRSLKSRAFLITSGARPAIPPIAGLERVPFKTYEAIFDNTTLPNSMVIIGGGPIGLEIAQAYQRLGTPVTIVTHRVLPKEDPDARELIQKVLEREGVQFLLEKALSVHRDSAGSVVVTTQHHQAQGDLLLVAVGRKPNVEELNLEEANVAHTPRGIPVDKHLRTNVKHIYAAGDVTGGYQFTHYAGWQAFQAVRNALLPGGSSGMSELVPRVTFTDPEIAQVGLTEQQAVSQAGTAFEVHRMEMEQVDRAVCEDDLSGFIKLVAKKDGSILGATVIGARAGETIVEIALAMKQGLKLKDIAGTIHPYPTYSTALQQMAADIVVKHLLSGTSGKLMRTLSKIAR
jgi:pyruvate/2-oxoglutarate dehydrogenase complex dihydrolipoamide dehydrogenase (E3) component